MAWSCSPDYLRRSINALLEGIDSISAWANLTASLKLNWVLLISSKSPPLSETNCFARSKSLFAFRSTFFPLDRANRVQFSISHCNRRNSSLILFIIFTVFRIFSYHPSNCSSLAWAIKENSTMYSVTLSLYLFATSKNLSAHLLCHSFSLEIADFLSSSWRLIKIPTSASTRRVRKDEISCWPAEQPWCCYR